ncbi:hypothetical protein [Streptomyces sp. NPDC008092]|uniref:hypothetical protein n=1 Tax=Streptomyces sp. NPDC008092 TaxID=3364808 RepID=UPI0036EBE3A2
MATAVLAPDTHPARIQDPVTFTECALLFMETGEPEFAGRPVKAVVRKLQRWAQQDHLRQEPRGRCLVVSYSDLLVAHANRHPAPRR